MCGDTVRISPSSTHPHMPCHLKVVSREQASKAQSHSLHTQGPSKAVRKPLGAPEDPGDLELLCAQVPKCFCHIQPALTVASSS